MATGASRKILTTTERFLLYDIPWVGYQSFLKVLGESAIRLTYDQGTLELMRTSFLRERYKVLAGRIINILTEELDMDVCAMGSSTFLREALERGVDPDLSYYFSAADKITDWDRIDLGVDPPPDLAVEIDVSNESRRRIAIYAALKIPEVWRFDGERMNVLKLQGPDAYQTVPRSGIFPFAPMEEVGRFLHQYSTGDDNQWAKAFRRWVREAILPRVQAEPEGE